MANTYTKLLIQFVFAVKHRESTVSNHFRARLEKYMTGILQNKNHKMLAIYCMPDHCHILFGMNPDQSLSDLARDVKSNSSKWINENKLTGHKFNWQDGFGAFSYAKSQLDTVVKYILNQPEHHKHKTFKEEYHEFLKKFNVEYDEKYLFDWLE